MIFVIDIDGTLADNSHRKSKLIYSCVQCGSIATPGQHCQCGCYDTEPDPKSFQQFMDPNLLIQDSIAPGAAEGVRSLRTLGSLVFLTGRRSSARAATAQWLAEQVAWDVGAEPLLMREDAHIGIPASEYKLLRAEALRNQYPTEGFMFFEDDPHVFDIYRKFGVVLRAPECWEHWNPRGSTEREPNYKA